MHICLRRGETLEVAKLLQTIATDQRLLMFASSALYLGSAVAAQGRPVEGVAEIESVLGLAPPWALAIGSLA